MKNMVKREKIFHGFQKLITVNVKIVKNVSLFVQEEFMMWKMAGLLSNIHIVV